MHFLLSCTTDSSSQAEAHLKFYRPIEHLKKFGVTIQRGFGCFDLYTPTDGYDLPKPRKYGSINTYMLYVDSNKFSQFFEELSKYPSIELDK